MEESSAYYYSPTLETAFSDPVAEESYLEFYNGQVAGRAIFTYISQILLYGIFLVIELFYNYPGYGESWQPLVVFRIFLIGSCCFGLFLILKKSSSKSASSKNSGIVAVYTFQSLLLILMYGACSGIYVRDVQNNIDYAPYLFYLGRWSLPNSIIFIYICFSTSGMKYQDAVIISSTHTLAVTAIPFLFFSNNYTGHLLNQQILYLPLMFCMNMVSVHDAEWQVRESFLMKCALGQKLKRQDDLITSILPQEIAVAIKSNRIENLAKYYDNVTILFCYIVDFGKNSSSSYAQDLLALLIRVITMFDRLVDLTEVYKVENIAETYMCVGGCPQTCDDHAVRIANMALAMMEAVQVCGWRWPDGTPLSLQIGIHTGPVVAGVVGSKSYSYHLFGDSVNTSSRMCSHALPGKIQMSASAMAAIERQCPGGFEIESRGPIEVKGKGLMHTYWLQDHAKERTSLRERLFASLKNKEMMYAGGYDRFSEGRKNSRTKIRIREGDLHFVKSHPGGPSSLQTVLRRQSLDKYKQSGDVGSGSGSTLGLTNQLREVFVRKDTLSKSSKHQTYLQTVKEEPIRDEEEDKTSSPGKEQKDAGGALGLTPLDVSGPIGDLADLGPPSVMNSGPMTPLFQSTVQTLSGSTDGANKDFEEIELEPDAVEYSFVLYFNRKNRQQFRRVVLFLGFLVTAIAWYTVEIGLIHNRIDFVAQRTLVAMFIAIFICGVILALTEWKDFQTIMQMSGVVMSYTILYSIFAGVQSSVDSLIVPDFSLILSALFVINLFIRLRFIYSTFSSLSLIIVYVAEVIYHGSYDNLDIGFIIFGVYVELTSLKQCYDREKGLRSDYLHVHVLEREGERSQKLLENMLPSTHHAELLIQGELILDELRDVTLLYSDMKGFTQLSATMHPVELNKLLNLMYSQFDKHLDHFGLYKVDTIGDAFVVVGGLEGVESYKKSKNHPLACIQFAFHMLTDTAKIRELCNVNVQMRIGIHTGSVMGSVVSLNKPRYLVWGPSTLIANAMESNGIPDQIMISYETKLRLDQAELSRLNITLKERESNSKIQKYTRSAHMLSCADMTPFFHDTWNQRQEIVTSSGGRSSVGRTGGALQMLSGIAKRLATTPISKHTNGSILNPSRMSMEISVRHSTFLMEPPEQSSTAAAGDDSDWRSSWNKDWKMKKSVTGSVQNPLISTTPTKFEEVGYINNNNSGGNSNGHTPNGIAQIELSEQKPKRLFGSLMNQNGSFRLISKAISRDFSPSDPNTTLNSTSNTMNTSNSNTNITNQEAPMTPVSNTIILMSSKKSSPRRDRPDEIESITNSNAVVAFEEMASSRRNSIQSQEEKDSLFSNSIEAGGDDSPTTIKRKRKVIEFTKRSTLHDSDDEHEPSNVDVITTLQTQGSQQTLLTSASPRNPLAMDNELSHAHNQSTIVVTRKRRDSSPMILKPSERIETSTSPRTLKDNLMSYSIRRSLIVQEDEFTFNKNMHSTGSERVEPVERGYASTPMTPNILIKPSSPGTLFFGHNTNQSGASVVPVNTDNMIGLNNDELFIKKPSPLHDFPPRRPSLNSDLRYHSDDGSVRSGIASNGGASGSVSSTLGAMFHATTRRLSSDLTAT